MAHFIIPFVIGITIFLVCYFIWRLNSIALLLRSLCTWFAHLLSIVAVVLMRWAATCKGRCIATLRDGLAEETSDWHLVSVVIIRLLYMVVSTVVLLGEVPMIQLRSGALYRTQVTAIHLPLDVLMGALWILVPAIWAFLFVEAAGGIEIEECLFPRMRRSKFARWCVAIIALAFFLASLGLNYYFQAFGQCIIVQDACANDGGLQIFIVSGFGVVLVASGVIAVRGLQLGLALVFPLVHGVLYCVLSLLSLICGLLSRGMADFGTQVIGSLNPRIFVPTSSTAIPASSHYPALTSPLGENWLEEQGEDETEKNKEKEAMTKRQRINSLVCFDNFGYQVGPLVLDALKQLQGLSTVLAVGLFDRKRPNVEGWGGNYNGITSISPLAHEAEKLRALYDSEELVHINAAKIMVNRLAQAKAGLRVHGNILVPTDLLNIPTLKEALYLMKNLLPTHNITVITALPAVDQHGEQRKNIIQACEILLKMQQEKVIETTILLDLRSRLAAQVGEGYQMRLVAKTIASLMISSFNNTANNPTFAEVMQRMGRFPRL